MEWIILRVVFWENIFSVKILFSEFLCENTLKNLEFFQCQEVWRLNIWKIYLNSTRALVFNCFRSFRKCFLIPRNSRLYLVTFLNLVINCAEPTLKTDKKYEKSSHFWLPTKIVWHHNPKHRILSPLTTASSLSTSR